MLEKLKWKPFLRAVWFEILEERVYSNVKIKLDSHLPKKLFCLLQWKPFKNDEKWFLFHLKSSLRSQDISIFVLSFWQCRKNYLIIKIGLISKFMTSQPGKKAITIHILPNISQSTGNQIMKLGQLIEYNKRSNFFKKSCRN